ncbi:aminotransferase class I/II-fold pyridoxal phosphate-dependent enzyme [Gorillibacterium sp. CAU 1737]|uniref:aminotransferase class I/II-fold pyridoxal phosphate-dependent enzyme n=1 Tax=Gorillibacterium sp. CAU 1737 TaxID=3140362 RepID=UPI0032603D3A
MTHSNKSAARGASDAPLLEALLDYRDRKLGSYHVPGHKGGQGVHALGAEWFRSIMELDYTEITGLDDLHHATGVIRQAEERAAACFGAEETHFLVGGSTAGNLALVMGLCGPGELLILPRNVHKSVLNGIALAGARCVFLPGRVDPASGLTAGVRPEDLQKALERYPEAKGVLLTNPNYYGMADDLSEAVRLVHDYGKPIVVDEAHGAHFGFHPALPPSAIACGADGVVQSTHKLLTAMTMGAMLHLQGDRLNRPRIRRVLSTVQSSSPSYPIMASLDLSRLQLETEGRFLLERGIAFLNRLEQAAEGWKALALLSREAGAVYGFLDPFKRGIYDTSGSLGGYQLQEKLEAHGCMTELADPTYVLCLFSLASTENDVERLIDALTSLDAEIAGGMQEKRTFLPNLLEIPPVFELSDPITIPWDAEEVYSKAGRTIERVPLAEAVGCYAAEMVIPYPPGIPLLYPGERITEAMKEALLLLSRSGARFQGSEEEGLTGLAITREPAYGGTS